MYPFKFSILSRSRFSLASLTQVLAFNFMLTALKTLYKNYFETKHPHLLNSLIAAPIQTKVNIDFDLTEASAVCFEMLTSFSFDLG